MSGIVIVLLIAVNLFISWLNAKTTGKMWLEAKAVGGFPRIMAWCGAIMSAIGFTYCYSIIISFALVSFNLIDVVVLQAVLSLSYLIIIVPCIGTGLIITMQSWIVAFRDRSLKNLGVAGWNTFATGYNIYNAVDGIPHSVSFLGDFFKDHDFDFDSDNKALWAIVIVAIAVLGGILTTRYIIEKNKGALGVSEEVRNAHAPIR